MCVLPQVKGTGMVAGRLGPGPGPVSSVGDGGPAAGLAASPRGGVADSEGELLGPQMAAALPAICSGVGGGLHLMNVGQTAGPRR